MNTLQELIDEMRRLILYEMALGNENTENAALTKAINRAYQETCYYAETPVLHYEWSYGEQGDPSILDTSKHVIDLSRYGLRSVYRVWWRPREAADRNQEIDLMDALFLQPEQDYRHLGAQRVLPDPTKEYRFPFPRVRWLPQKVATSGNPSTFAFVDGKLFLDASTEKGRIRLIGAFVPSEESDAPVKVLSGQSDKTAVPAALNEAILYLAMSYWLMPYPDLVQLSQFYRVTAFETIQMHVNVAQTGVFSRSPHSYAENLMGVINQETARRQKRAGNQEG